jgi:hypothetical protein
MSKTLHLCTLSSYKTKHIFQDISTTALVVYEHTKQLLSVRQLHIFRQHFKFALATSVGAQTSDLTGIPSRTLTLPQ